MREILFKAKRVDNGKWVEFHSNIQLRDMDGNIVAVAVIPKGTPIKGFKNLVDVIPETVCQFIGKRDKNSERIFEGDNINASWGGIERVPSFVVLEKGSWRDNMGNHNIYDADWIIITGNVHDEEDNE